MNIRWICIKIKINRKMEVSFNQKTLNTQHRCDNEMNKRYKALPGPWRMNRRKSNKNEKALDTTQFIVKKNCHYHFKFQKKAPFLQMGNGVFRKNYFPIEQLCSCRNGEKSKGKKERRGQKIERSLGFQRKIGWERKIVLKRENRENEIRENGETKWQSEF